MQRKLREELWTVNTSEPGMEELNALPYLDAVVHEVLRLYPPIPHSVRVAKTDDVIPVGKPYVDRFGKTQTSIR